MRSASRRQDSYHADEENPYWISFSDIMAGLLVIFVLAAVALILELTQKSELWDEAIQEMARAEEIRRDILQEIEEELGARNIPVTVIDNDTVLRIPEDVLTFEQSSFDIPSELRYQEIALEIGQVLYASISKDDRWEYLDTIFVEGHSDSDRYENVALKGNWGLSTFRAISVWNYWNEKMPEGTRLEELNNHIGRRLFSVSGYAETRPISCTNDDVNIDDINICPEGRLDDEASLRKNRRIDIRFTVKRPILEDYQAIGDALN